MAVLGSINMDVVVRVGDFPRPGETIMSQGVSQTSGGKGANQAIAAARMGRHVAMIGALGDDDNGKALRAVLEGDRVDTGGIESLAGVTTGVAHVIVSDAGENMIMVLAGANGAVTKARVKAQTPQATVYLAQLETPVAAVAEFFRIGKANGGLCILNTAPAVAQAASLFDGCDIIVLNETELASYCGQVLEEGDPEAVAKAAESLISRDGQTIIVTLGARGVVAVTKGWRRAVAGRKVAVVDTTGAGDCFCGVLAAGLSEGLALVEALERANAAAAIAVGRSGAALAAPTLAEVEDFLRGKP